MNYASSSGANGKRSPIVRLLSGAGLFILVLAFLAGGFFILRDGNLPKLAMTLFAIVWGVGGAALIFWAANWIAEQFSDEWTARLQPIVFVLPAVMLLAWYLAIPAVRTFYLSLFDRNGVEFIGFQNYASLFTNRALLEPLRNNVMWLIFGTSFSVIFGLLVAVLADRSKVENLGKTMIFLPMAISFVGASVIWKFIYEQRPIELPQIGLLNAIIVAFGGSPKAWYAWTDIIPWNNLFLIVIMVWLQTGFAMVIFSAAIKGIPEDLLEAARVDGASEVRIFFQIMLPSIRGTIITVTTTIVIFALKIFDIIWVMTGGQFGTEVIATSFYRQSFVARNAGMGSAIAIILLLAVVPVMVYNLKQFNEEESF